MKTYHSCPELVTYLRNYKINPVNSKAHLAKSKVVSRYGDLCLSHQHATLKGKADWPGAMSMIVRNQPDERNITITTLPNNDTAAVLLAVRLGINMHLAVALAYEDYLEVAPLNEPDFWQPRLAPSEACVLGTFQPVGDEHSTLALVARRDIRNYCMRFSPEELILLPETEGGLFQPFRTSHVMPGIKSLVSFRTDEPVLFEEEAVAAAPITITPPPVSATKTAANTKNVKALAAIHASLSAYSLQHDGTHEEAMRLMEAHAQGRGISRRVRRPCGY